MQPKIGLVAGWGRYPIVVAEALKAQGCQVYCLGLKDHADQSLAEICDDYREVGVAKLGTQIRYFRRHGVARVTLAGKLNKAVMFRPFYLLKHMPDLRCVRKFYPHFFTRTKDRADDTLLSGFVEAYAEDGITIAPASEFAPELLVQEGVLSARRPSSSERQDIAFGWRLAKELGRLDVGQTVVVKGRAAIALEAVEGTDECIRRAGRLCPAGGFTVVKVAKPQQDMRFDVPTIGAGTIESLLAAGGRVLAVEAEKTILIDEPRVLNLARRHRLTIIALSQSQAAALPQAA